MFFAANKFLNSEELLFLGQGCKLDQTIIFFDPLEMEDIGVQTRLFFLELLGYRIFRLDETQRAVQVVFGSSVVFKLIELDFCKLLVDVALHSRD